MVNARAANRWLESSLGQSWPGPGRQLQVRVLPTAFVLTSNKGNDMNIDKNFIPNGLLSNYKMCEGIGGTWRYHLCRDDSETEALCGKPTMPCRSLISSWGYKPDHMPTSYCKECERIALNSKTKNDKERIP